MGLVPRTTANTGMEGVCDFFVCADGKQKTKKKTFSPSLPSATLGKEGFAECRDHGTRQSWEAETQFPSFAECQSHGTRQRFFLKRKNFFAECKSMALDKEFSKKKSLPSAAEVALGKEAVRVDVGFFFAEC